MTVTPSWRAAGRSGFSGAGAPRSGRTSGRAGPAGRRGAAFGVAHDGYRGGDILATMAAANAEGLLIAQVETVAGVREAEAIAAVDGIDVLWVGHFDLTNSMGIPGQFDHP